MGCQAVPERRSVGEIRDLASGIEGDSDALPIRTDARVAGATLKAGETAEYTLGADRSAYLVSATGAIEVNGVRLNARDGAAVQKEDVLSIRALEDSEIVLVDTI